MVQKLKHVYQFEPEVSVIKKGSPGERTDLRSSHSQMFFKIDVPKNYSKLHRKTSALESLFNKVADLNA